MVCPHGLSGVPIEPSIANIFSQWLFTDAKAPRHILTETAIAYEADSIITTQIKAQRLDVKPKTALATEECIRAYTIWHNYATTGEVQSYERSETPGGTNLAFRLLENILATFSMGFEGDTELIQSRLGSPWQALVSCMSGLCEKTLPGAFILLCMLDAVIVMTFALRKHWRAQDSRGDAVPLRKEDLEAACTWYTTAVREGGLSPQQQTHRHVGSLLREEGVPRDSCVANLQMKIHEVVDLALDMRVDQDSETSLEKTRSWMAGAITGMTGWVTGIQAPGLLKRLFGSV